MEEVFGSNAIVYQQFFFDQFRRLGLKSTLPFEEYVRWVGHGLRYAELLPPDYCGGISLGDARNLDGVCKGVDLDERPVLKALLTRMEELHRLGRQFGYKE